MVGEGAEIFVKTGEERLNISDFSGYIAFTVNVR